MIQDNNYSLLDSLNLKSYLDHRVQYVVDKPYDKVLSKMPVEQRQGYRHGNRQQQAEKLFGASTEWEYGHRARNDDAG